MTFQAGVIEVAGARETRKIDKDTIEITIRGRPITVNIPLQYQADYDINTEVRLPQSPSLTKLSLSLCSGRGP